MNRGWTSLWRVVAAAASVAGARATRYRTTPRPLLMVLELTDVCNLRCSFCTFRRDRPSDDLLTLEELRRLFKDAVGIGLAAVSITGGGEPMLHPHFAEVVRMAARAGLVVAVTTNGTLIRERNLSSFAPCDVVVMSLDSLGANRMANHAGPAIRDRVLGGLRLLRAAYPRLRLYVQMVIDENNWREVPQFNRFFHARGVETLFQPRYQHRIDIDRKRWAEIAAGIRYRDPLTRLLFGRYNRAIPDVAAGTKQPACLALTSTFVVRPNGRVTACHLADYAEANIRREPLSRIWPRLAAPRRYIDGPNRPCRCGDTAYIPYGELFFALAPHRRANGVSVTPLTTAAAVRPSMDTPRDPGSLNADTRAAGEVAGQ